MRSSNGTDTSLHRTYVYSSYRGERETERKIVRHVLGDSSNEFLGGPALKKSTVPFQFLPNIGLASFQLTTCRVYVF